MRCRTRNPFLRNKPVQVADLWEVLITKNLWSTITAVAKARKCSMSTITRYCAFRLAEKETLAWKKTVKNAHLKARSEQSANPHRHRHIVCLYGEDVILLRLAALRLRLTVSAFLRLALQLYLPRLHAPASISKMVSAMELFWRGIKRWKCVPLGAINHEGVPTFRRFAFSSFMPWEWWGIPGLDFS